MNRITQHALDGPQVCSALQQMGGKGVAESMRTYRFVNSRHGGKILDYLKHHHPGERTSAPYAQEQVGLGTRFDVDMAPVAQVQFYLVDGLVGYGNQTLFAALASYADETLTQIQVFHLEGAEFRYTKSATVHGLYHGPVTLALFCGEVYLLYDAVYLGN